MGNKRFLIWLAVILFFVIVVICWLPYLLTQFSILDFTETGQIGDTIGGTMSPFVGILAAILTFMAFWIQYQANEEQRASIADNKTEIQKQQKRYIIDRFEGKWLMLLDIYKETVKSLHYSNVTGKPVFKELLEELHLTYEMVEYGYTRSMSKKGCSPDNSACEGFFGRMKNEMFYGRNFVGVTIETFIQIINDYITWYNTKRIKASLGYMSPMEYRQSLGLA